MQTTILILLGEMIVLSTLICFILLAVRKDMKRYRNRGYLKPRGIVRWLIRNLPEESPKRNSA